jgi:hypothetical protein
VIKIKKIFHRGDYQIAIYFDGDVELTSKVRAANATWSKSQRCWYVPYTKERYNQLKELFTEIEVIPEGDDPPVALPKGLTPTILPGNFVATGINPPATGKPGKPAISKRYIGKWEGKIEVLKDIGKYWVLRIPYSEPVSHALLKIKGIYWSNREQVYLVFRHIAVKTQVEALLGISNVLPENYYRSSDGEHFNTGEMVAEPNNADRKSFLLIVPPISHVIQSVKRWRGVRYSKMDNAYIIPATPDMIDNLVLLAAQSGINFMNNLPHGYVRNEYAPNQKKIKLQVVVDNLERQIPAQVKGYVNAMMDYLMAKNYSDSTLRTYTESFLLFLRQHEYKDPDVLTEKDIVRYLAAMMQNGLSASSGHSLVNALLFYYRNVLKREAFELVLPRPKKEKKLPAVLTMAECFGIFNVIDNPKHRLLLLLGYGAGLRLGEIISLKWSDILMSEFKIHIKGAKGKKDRIVMLPFSIQLPGKLPSVVQGGFLGFRGPVQGGELQSADGTNGDAASLAEGRTGEESNGAHASS